MAQTRRPSSAQLFVDETAGFPSLEVDTDPTIRRAGSNQNLVHDANHHADDGTNIWTSQSDVVQAGELPRTSGPVTGAPSAVQPAGSKDESLQG